MSNGSNKPERAGKPYLQEEVDLILSLVPTEDNIGILAKSLRRSKGAIEIIYQYAYSGEWLKRDLGEMEPHQKNILTMTGVAKKKLRIVVGHLPK